METKIVGINQIFEALMEGFRHNKRTMVFTTTRFFGEAAVCSFQRFNHKNSEGTTLTEAGTLTDIKQVLQRAWREGQNVTVNPNMAEFEAVVGANKKVGEIAQRRQERMLGVA